MPQNNDVDQALTFRTPDFTPPQFDHAQARSDVREAYQRDLGRIIHSASFRRLQTKTQVMGTGEGDFHRTRLTHSLEVGQIGRGIVWQLASKMDESDRHYLPSSELMEAICYAHDLGHPPFGHGGEVALHKMMAPYGGFEGNAQTIRILTQLEKYSPSGGLRPTRRLLLGVLKYPVAYSEYGERRHGHKPPKCFYDDDRGLIDRALEVFSETDAARFRTLGPDGKPLYRTFDCSIMEIADDIAYGVHDLEDGIARKLLVRDDVEPNIRDIFGKSEISAITAGKTSMPIDNLLTELFSKELHRRKYAISMLVGYFVEQTRVSRRKIFESPYLDLQASLPDGPKDAIARLSKDITYQSIIRRPEVQTLEYKGEMIIKAIFEALSHDPLGLIGEDTLKSLSSGLSAVLHGGSPGGSDWRHSADGPRNMVARAICDFIASMTNASAERYHRRLFEPGYGNSIDELQ